MNNNHNVQVSVRVTDMATDPLRRISQQANQMSKDFRNIGTSLGAFSNTMGKMASSLDKVANSMYRFNMYTSSIQRNLRNLAIIGAGAGVALGAQSMNKSIGFEFQTHKMQTRMETTDKVRKDIEQYILNELNKQVMFKPTDIASLGIMLGQAGVDNFSDMKSMLKTTTFFSESVDANIEEAGEMILAAAKGFDISLSKSSEITDKLTVAVNKSLLRVEEMPHAIGELAGRSKMLGQSLDSSLVALMVGRDQGMSAAQTAQNFLHGLRQMSLIGRDDVLWPRRRSYYEKLGVDTSFFDLDKKQLKEFPEIIESLEKSMSNLGFMPSKEEFARLIEANDGRIPDGVIDKMKSMPLISRVFGAAGQTPIIMGLQARYEEVDRLTGEKTGNVYYGSDALKKMREDVSNSSGAVETAHEKIAETAKFHLGVLAGAWEAAQIKIADDFLPVVKIASNELVDYLYNINKPGALDRFNQAIKESASNLRESNPLLADLVELLGDVATNSIKIGDALGPTFQQIGKAGADSLLNGDWGNSLLTLPYHAVKNGLNFIGDVAASNPDSDEAISQLPPELQDGANLTRKLIQGGVALAAAGAIVKILELAIRSASLLIKGGKYGADLSKALIDLLFGTSLASKGAGMAGQTVAMTANVVNVYGSTVNGPGGSGPGGTYVGGPGGKNPPNTPQKTPSRVDTYGKNKGTKIPGKLPKIPGGIMLPLALGSAVLSGHSDPLFFAGMTSFNPYVMGTTAAIGTTGWMASNWENVYNDPDSIYGNSRAITGKNLEKPMSRDLYGDVMGTNKGLYLKPGDEQINALSNYLKTAYSEENSAIASSINDINKTLENVKVENNIELNPTIVLSGDLKDVITNVRVESDYERYERRMNIMEKRLSR